MRRTTTEKKKMVGGTNETIATVIRGVIVDTWVGKTVDGTTTPRKNGGNSMRRMGGTDCPTEDTTHVANYNNDEPYVNDECYSIRMGGGNGDSPGGTPGEESRGRTTGEPMYCDDEDPTEFLVWMAGGLLTRLNRLTEETRCLQRLQERKCA